MGLSLSRSLTGTGTRKSRVARCPESPFELKRKSRATRSRQDQPARFHVYVYCYKNNAALCMYTVQLHVSRYSRG